MCTGIPYDLKDKVQIASRLYRPWEGVNISKCNKCNKATNKGNAVAYDSAVESLTYTVKVSCTYYCHT
jgi:hypothetical protein